MERKSTPRSPYNMKPSVPLSFFSLLVKKGSDKSTSIYSYKKFFVVVPVAMRNSFVFRDGFLGVIGNVKFVCIECIWTVIMLKIDVHLDFGNNWVQNVGYMSNERKWCLLFLLRCGFLIHFCLFLVLLF